ncbi:MAG: acyl-CoA thioesterase [Gemmatimonadaceae bacterium]|jgi:acyl-CoA thioester hydrolase|nr:acyl-CoA thioesterase [Gemmatimonadaceae bacterium]
MTGRPFEVVEYVRWADVDLAGIMRFSAVPRFVELAEQELMRAAGYPYTRLMDHPSFWMPRRQLVVDYLAPARLDEALTLVTYVPRFGESSLSLHVDLYGAGGRAVATTAMVLVCVNAETFRTQPMPDEYRRVLEPYACPVDVARMSRQADASREPPGAR